MPADFLIDEQGVIRLSHYGSNEGDQPAFEQFKVFAVRPGAAEQPEYAQR
jgi:hypothetical protein